MGATPATGPTLGTRHPTPMRHIFTVTLGIAEALASTFTLHPQITAIGTADPDISIIGIAASIVVGKVAQSLPTQVAGAAHIAARQGSPQFAACFISNVAHAKNDRVGTPVIQIRHAAGHDQGLVCHSTFARKTARAVPSVREFSLSAGPVHSCPGQCRSAWIVRDGSKRIPRNISGFSRDTSRSDRVCEKARGVASNLHSTSCERQRARESECNC